MQTRYSQFKIAIPLALAFGALFLWLQKSGILSSFSFGSMSYPTAFAIGIIASLSTCMAVVGGLVLSMSAVFAKSGRTVSPQIYFHASRLAAFFLLGGAIGALGKAFTLSITATVALNIAIALVMLALGLNLLELRFARRFEVFMPRFVSRRALDIFDLKHQWGPLFAGVATFFLPCGFTQAMQIATLSAGSFLKGGLTMLVFALGTLPVLSLISFGFSVLKDESKKGVLFKTAGLVVVMFALLNLYSGLVLLGVVPPLFNF